MRKRLLLLLSTLIVSLGLPITSASASTVIPVAGGCGWHQNGAAASGNHYILPRRASFDISVACGHLRINGSSIDAVDTTNGNGSFHWSRPQVAGEISHYVDMPVTAGHAYAMTLWEHQWYCGKWTNVNVGTIYVTRKTK